MAETVSDAQLQNLRARIEALRGRFYSPIDFGSGLVMKPPRVVRRFRRRLRLLQIPEDLTGKTVLDIGAWDGFFSFEFERRGAKRVLAIDTYAWDQGGFDCFLLAHEYFRSKVEHRRMDVHELSPETVGTFDLVFCAGVLYHMRHPLLGLERIRSVTAGQLILETNSLIPAFHERAPLITFFSGDAEYQRARDRLAWDDGAYPTKAWVADALVAAGFARHEFIYTPSFKWGKKLVALFTGRPQRGRLIVRAFAAGEEAQSPYRCAAG
jgi:tRNA (mo5U34)-methyltransferase